jgi:PAS domain S-box-containing protein
MEPAGNVITLSFRDNDLEAAFRKDYFEKRVPQLRLDLILGTFLYSLFGIHDYWVIPDIKEFAWLLRYCIVCPLLIGVFVFSFSRYFRKVMELSAFVAGFTAGAAVVLMIVRASPPGNYMSYAGLLIILLFYFRLRFVTASALTWSIFILYGAVAIWDAGIPAHVMFSNLFILFTFSITGLFMCYTQEQNVRSAFLLKRTIQERNDKIAETNRKLEKEVTERRQAEIALLERMKFLRTLLDTIPNPIFYTDVHGRYAGCNRAYEVFSGRSNEELTGSSALDLNSVDFVHGSDVSETRGYGCPGIRTGEALLRHADGTERNVLFSRADYADIEGKPAGMVGVILDITELKKAEEDKLRLKAQLFQSQKIEALGQLAGGIAHEFNNILTAILGYSHLLRKHMPEEDPLRFFVDNTIASSERAARLTKDILAFGRKQKVDPKPVNLNEIVKKSESLLMMMIGEDTELAVSLCDESITVLADGGLISQVLMNLASNARDAMPRGGLLSVSTSLAHKEREFPHAHGIAQHGSYGLITFSDTGIGIDMKTRERIFEPFFTTKEVGKGTGLGLSIVYGIVNQHHGYIDVDTEFAKGTTFSIYLPVAAADERRPGQCTSPQPPIPDSARHPVAAAPQPDPEDDCPYPSGSEKLLVAEDNDTVRTLTKNLLQENGYTVIEASHGEDAIRRFMENADEIRLLLLDVRMPKKNGWEVYDTIRKIRPDVRVIFMSGYTADVFVRKLIPKTGMKLLEKPIPPGDLLRALRMELDRQSTASGMIRSAE